MKRRLQILGFLFVLCCGCAAQAQSDSTAVIFSLKIDKEDSLADVQSSPTNRAMAEFQVVDMRQRGIIVRLNFFHKQVAAYKNAGKERIAMEIQKKAIIGINAALGHLGLLRIRWR